MRLIPARSATSSEDRCRHSRASLICSPIYSKITWVFGKISVAFLLMVNTSLNVSIFDQYNIVCQFLFTL